MSRLAWLVLALCSAAALLAGEGADLELGRLGTGQGRLSGVMDIGFDAAGRLYVLDWAPPERNKPAANGLVQVYQDGKFARQFSVLDPALGERNAPSRLAVDARGQVWVTQPKAGLVQCYSAEGKLAASVPVPGALGLVVRGEQVLVAPELGRRPVSELAVVSLDGQALPALRLARPLTGIVDLATDRAGRLYLIAAVNQLYQFAPDGKLLNVIGAGATTRAQDGSELLHTVALDSQGRVYSMTFGNPGLLARFDAGFTTVATREGQFKWADPWSVHSGYVPLAVDPSDRLWVGVPGQIDDSNPRYHFKPCVLRVEASFLDAGNRGVTIASTKSLGLKPTLETGLPYDVAYDLAPRTLSLVVAPASRRITTLRAAWRVQDTAGVVQARGQLDLALTDGAEARASFTFQPPRYGWYTISADLSSAGEPLFSFGQHLGVTPAYADLPRLAAGESPGGPADIPRSAWCGLKLVRVHTGQGAEALAKHVADAARYGCVLLVQFESKERCTSDHVRQMVERFKGRVRYWEVINEPNFSVKVEDYVPLLRQVRETIRAVDPAAQLLGPAVCGIQLPWYQRFYELGGGPLVDILSLHDYEGHESIDPNHWVWKMGELRALMAQHGDRDKAIWQTERAICGVRGDNFLGGAQAVRMVLHRDLLERLGIASEHNLHYYLNSHGYGAVPTFIWSAAGPHPAALALRTRAGLLGARRLAGTLDFGPVGNRLFWGDRYTGAAEGDVVVLRNLGLADEPLSFGLRGGRVLGVVDAWGNDLPAGDAGGLRVTLGQLPVYVRLAPGAQLVPPRLDFGPNLAQGATFRWSAETQSDFARLTNGLYETIHAGHPHGGTDKPPIWTGTLPSLPQTLEIDLGAPRTVTQVVLTSLRADNAFCALLDFDLQGLVGEQWVDLAAVGTPCPPSEAVRTPLAAANTWYLDTNAFWLRCRPTSTQKLRLVVRRVTHGFLPDEHLRAWGRPLERKLMLKEVEVYGVGG